MTDKSLSDAAVAAALSQNWNEAIAINKCVLRQSPANIEAMNRLGYAYIKTGNMSLAKQFFQKVLKIDIYNRIAENNIKKISVMKKHAADAPCTCTVSPLLFLEEPGKTKIVECINIANSNILSSVSCGQEVVFKCKKYAIDIRTTAGTYVGALPDDLSFRLLTFMKAGNQYTIHIKRVAKSCVSVFIREIKRGKRFIHQASFSGMNSIPSVRDHEQELKQKNGKEPSVGDEDN